MRRTVKHDLMLALPAPMAVARKVPEKKKIVAYVPNWIDLEAYAKTIPYERLTHINLAFENPVNADGDLSFNPRNKAVIRQAREKGVKVLISIGGGSASTNKELMERYFDLLSDKKRAGFAARLTEYVVQHQFDGLDVDIEGPAINGDYGKFIEELAKNLKPRGKLLTAALSQGYGGDKVPDSVFQHYDFLNIMAYDGTGPWNPDRPGQHSSLEMAKNSAVYWLKRGLPKAKAVLGVPFYGYGFGEAFRNHDYSYSEIVAAYPGAEEKDEVGKTIFYNGIPTIQAKSRYVVDEGLGGVMIWHLQADAAGKHSLLTALHAILEPTAPKKP